MSVFPFAALRLHSRRPAGGASVRLRRWLLAALCWLWAASATAGDIELGSLSLVRQPDGLMLSFAAQPVLSAAVQDALQRGVALYFVAEAKVMRKRWYWRNERIAQATRTWRLSYQPLTSTWRVNFGAFSQTAGSAREALALVSKAVNWKIADADALESGSSYYVEFRYWLDSSQLPRPMQLDLTLQDDWRLSVERTLRLD